jgi:antitoxin ParD1/3/4
MVAKQITRNIALTPHFDEFVRAKIDSGRYQSASEVVREGLRLLEERDYRLANLRSEIELGWQQSERGELVDGPSVFAEIRRMSKERRRAAKSKR